MKYLLILYLIFKYSMSQIYNKPSNIIPFINSRKNLASNITININTTSYSIQALKGSGLSTGAILAIILVSIPF